MTTLICFSLFLIPIIFGSPSSYDQLNTVLIFLIIGIISCYPIKRDLIKIRRVYIFIIGIISLLIIASFLNYIIYYAIYDDVSIYSYFSNIKYTNESIREWLGFAHPAYISIFSIIGMYFAFESYKQEILNKKQFILNILITFSLVIVLGSRVALVIFAFMITTFVLQNFNYKKMLFIYFIIFCIGTVTMIHKIDPIRHQLWSVSMSAIKERPLLGYGIGASKDIISDKELHHINGFTTLLELNHPHNQFINFTLEIGILGFLVLLTVLLLLSFRYKEKMNKNFTTLIFIWSILSLIESPFETSKPTFLFCFLLLITTETEIFTMPSMSPFKI